jgi:FAD synthase
VLTFEPHPRITLGNDEGLKLLSTLEEKCLLLESVGVDYVVVIPFDEAFSRLSREVFTDDYLVGRLGIKELIVGYNHHFGHNKGGDYNYLATQGLEVTRVAQQLVESNKVSSTVVRATIERGDMRVANQLLGHTYIIIGTSDNNGFIATDSYKLLPPTGSYRAIINGVEGEIRVVESGICCSINNKLITIEL